jgi:hypothetical protein
MKLLEAYNLHVLLRHRLRSITCAGRKGKTRRACPGPFLVLPERHRACQRRANRRRRWASVSLSRLPPCRTDKLRGRGGYACKADSRFSSKAVEPRRAAAMGTSRVLVPTSNDIRTHLWASASGRSASQSSGSAYQSRRSGLSPPNAVLDRTQEVAGSSPASSIPLLPRVARLPSSPGNGAASDGSG